MHTSIRHLLLHSAASLVAAGAATTALAADGPRYTYGELGYAHVDFDDVEGVGAKGDGWNINGSVAVTDMVHLVASYTDANIDVDNFGFGNISADYSEFGVGAGLNFAVADTIDLVAQLGYVKAKVDVNTPYGSGSADEDGYAIGGGVRAMVLPAFELNGGVTYVDLGGDYGSDTSIGLGAVYNFTEMVAVSGGFSYSSDATQYGVGLRLYFGNR